jgi:hypothetical protein
MVFVIPSLGAHARSHDVSARHPGLEPGPIPPLRELMSLHTLLRRRDGSRLKAEVTRVCVPIHE